MSLRVRLLAVFGLVGAFVSTAHAQNVETIAKIKDWTVFSQELGNDRICFATTAASDKAPRDVRHGDVYFFVSAWKSGRSGSSQSSLRVGYDLREDLPPNLIISGRKWRMFPAGDEAFLEDKAEKSVLNALKRGSELRVEAVSQRDTRTAYHFSLRGSANAIDRALRECD